MGLVGTGSYDYAISERVVPAGFTFSITDPDQLRGGSLYGLGVLGMTSIGHAGFALGVSRRAIDEVVALSGRKQRLGHADSGGRCRAFPVRARSPHRDAQGGPRVPLRRLSPIAEAQLAARQPRPRSERLALRQATTHVAHVSSAVVDFAYHWSGADGIRPGVMQRLWRDTHASTDARPQSRRARRGATGPRRWRRRSGWSSALAPAAGV